MKRTWKNTGKLISDARKKLDPPVSQFALTKLVIGNVGNGQFFWNIERGLAGLPPKHLFKTSKVLMIPLHDLKEAMIKDYRDNLEAMIKEELEKL